MHTRRSPLSLLTIICFIAVFGLAACTGNGVKEVPTTEAAPTTPTLSTSTPTPEESDHSQELSAEKCTTGSSELTSRLNTSEEEYQDHVHNNAGLADWMRRKYNDLLWRQPNVQDVSSGFLRDGKGGWIETKGIIVYVSKKVDQGTLPPEDRIPDCLEGIPVQIVEAGHGILIGALEEKDEEESDGSD